MTAEPTPAVPAAADASIGQLVSQVSAQTSRLIRDELRLAQVELAEKGKKAGIGAGLFGGAGVFAGCGFGCLVAAAVLGLAAGPLSGWLAALIVAAALFVIAGAAALVGKREVAGATPPVPTEAVEGIQQDVQTLKAGSNA